MSWSDDKELSLGVDAIGWNSLKKKKNYHTDAWCAQSKLFFFLLLKLLKKKKNINIQLYC